MAGLQQAAWTHMEKPFTSRSVASSAPAQSSPFHVLLLQSPGVRIRTQLTGELGDPHSGEGAGRVLGVGSGGADGSAGRRRPGPDSPGPKLHTVRHAAAHRQAQGAQVSGCRGSLTTAWASGPASSRPLGGRVTTPRVQERNVTSWLTYHATEKDSEPSFFIKILF